MRNYSRQKNTYLIFTALSLVEGLFTFFAIASIPSDPKNAIIAGYSSSRLILLGISLILIGIHVFLLIQSKRVLEVFDHFLSKKRFTQVSKWIGVISGIFLWLTIWFPSGRLEELSASYLRIKPLLLWIELIIFQYYLFLKLAVNEIDLKNVALSNGKWKKTFLILLIVLMAGAGIFELLKFLAPEDVGHRLIYPPGAPLSALQVFSVWVLFLSAFLLEQKKPESAQKTKWIIITCLLLWAIAFVVWNSTPLVCTDDRPGPFPPNDQCYPAINDAVYSIGSHYTALGEGIYNRWMTDKPLYMIFLALGQWIAGPRIDRYLVFQIAILSTIPALLFLLGKKYAGYAGGLFLASLAILLHQNEIILYRLVGGVNAKVENTELLTALFLILLCFTVFKWWNQSNKLIWASISGAILGGASLLRLNPLFVAPVIILATLIFGWKRKKSLFPELAVFVIGLLLVFSPAIASARDSQGQNYYLAKIQSVIAERYPIKGVTETLPEPLQTIPLQQPSSDYYQNDFIYPLVENEPNDGMNIITYFLNNQYSSLAILPTNFSFISINDQVRQPLWNFDSRKLIWNANLSIENIVALAINCLVVIIGIWVSIKKHGVAGLTALLVQIGYNFGNAAAKTSGGRYLQPVNWVTLLYFSIGVVAISSIVLRVCRPASTENPEFKTAITDEENNREKYPSKRQIMKLSGLMILFLALGLLVPLMNHLPSRLPHEVNSNANQLAADKLQSTGAISADQWQEFIQDPDHLVIQGKAYHARYYRNDFYRSGDLSFEIMLLGGDHVFVSYLFNDSPKTTFTDESDVILIGCRLREDDLWAADRIIMRSFAIIQLDHEQSFMVDPLTNWRCE